MKAFRISVASLAALSASACATPERTINASQLPACESLTWDGALEARECMIYGAADQVFRVRFAAVAEGSQGGQVSVDVSYGETLVETNVSEYRVPSIEDVDGDGALDVLIPRETGNVNTTRAIWRFVDGRFLRLGEVSSVSLARTAEGYLAAPARSGAAEWNVAYYRIGATALEPLATVTARAEADANGVVKAATCGLSEAPGVAALGLSAAEAEAKFCAEPAAQVFGS